MVTFNPIHREYIGPADLNVVANTYNTLEQGHQKAVQTASDLKLAISKLDLNEKESEFRRQIYNDIQNTIQENTLYGNSYAALDDIIAESGNIFSREDLKGRLNAQAAYKNYMAQIDNSKLPEEYKKYYRKYNYYDYKDKYDSNGNVIEGDAWKPQNPFVDSIDTFKVMQNALQIAAKEAGGGQVVNENGQWLVKQGTQYQRLTADKIRAAIKSAFASTPGMDASLHQDWKIQVLEGYNERLKDNKGKPFIDTNITDSNGNMLSEEKFIEKQVNDFVDAAKYNNVFTTIDYQAIPQHVVNSRNNTVGSGNSPLGDALFAGSHIEGTVDATNNVIAAHRVDSAKASKVFMDLITKPNTIRGIKGGAVTYTALRDFVSKNSDADITGPGTTLNAFFEMINPNTGKPYRNDYTPEEQLQLRNAANHIYEASKAIDTISSNIPSEYKDGFNFGNSINNGTFKAGNSKYDDEIIKLSNKLYANNNNIEISMPEDMYETFIRYYNGIIPDYFSVKTKNGEKIVTVNETNRNALAEISNNVIKANDETSTWWTPDNWFARFTTGSKRNRYTIIGDFKQYSDENEKLSKLNMLSGVSRANTTATAITNNPEYDFRKLANTYNKGIEENNKANQYLGEYSDLRVSVMSTNASSATQFALESMNGGYYSSDDKRQLDIANSNLDNIFGSSAYSAGLIYEVKDYGDKEALKFTKAEDSYALQQLIQYMYREHPDKVSRTYGSFNGVIDNRIGNLASYDGYYLTFTVPDKTDDNSKLKQLHGGDKAKGKTFKIFISGTIDEGTGMNIGSSTAQQAFNAVTAAKQSIGTPYPALPYSKSLGETNIGFTTDGIRYIHYLGKNIPVNDDEELTNFWEVASTIDQAKAAYNTYYDINTIDNSLEKVYTWLAIVGGFDKDYIKNKVLDYIRE